MKAVVRILVLVMFVAAGAGFSPWLSAAGTVRYVSPGGTCAGRSPCYSTIHAAVDAASPGDDIRIASGLYTGTRTVSYAGVDYKQVVFISKTLTLRGGFSIGDWETADPAHVMTQIDAGGTAGAGRGMTIVGQGSETVTVEGLTISGGDYTGLGNPPGVSYQGCDRTGSDCGGGMLAKNVRLVLRDMTSSDNRASQSVPYSDGGGLYLSFVRAGSRIESTSFISNTATASGGQGGAITADFSADLVIEDCSFFQNQSHGDGGLSFCSSQTTS